MLGIFLIPINTAFAQTDAGRIVGTVTDVNGAVVPNATVVVKNDRTGEERTVTTSEEGIYLVPALKASFYSVSVTAQGLEAKADNLQVSVGQELNLNLTLQPSGVATSVDVVASSEAALDTGSARIGANVNEREVEGLPINGRQLSQLYLQAPGSVNTGSGTFADIRFSGRANQQNVVRYDGVEGTAIIDSSPGNLNGEVPTPFRLQSSLENVQEFRVDSSNYPAEYGTGTGGQINVVTKSGGNDFHGSLFEYLRNDALDARNFFDVVGKSPLRLNQFGGSLGGPIVKDKFFFFGSYEGYRLRSGINNVEAVPSAAACARAVAATQPFCLAAFRSPDAVVLPGASTSADFDILQLQSSNTVDENAFSGRLDLKFNTNNSMFFRFFRDKGTNNSPEGVTGRRTVIEAVPQNAVLEYQSIISPSVINEAKIGYNGARTRINGFAPTVNGVDLSAVILNISGQVANSGIPGQGGNSGIAVPGGLVRANSATNGRGQPYTPYSLGFID
ncbi:MAG TPA: carboxypeptidase-like regulatory domain-containing protein, partial [Pyrinomonadaceae bacterium]|nr:carboxypeptidase-like regulatory domain-containing protein [Pyrinomonadaceae bacterium]